jgi:cytochrome c-type biogenesis protein
MTISRRWICLVALTAAACAAGGDFRPLVAGDPAPHYSAVSLAGDSVSIASFEGNVVLVNVWATWCIPCREEMPALERLQSKRATDGLRVVGVNIDAHGDGQVRAFAENFDISFTILLDPRATITRTFRTTGVPESILIGRDGRIAKRWIGAFDPFSTQALQAIDDALTANRPTSSS